MSAKKFKFVSPGVFLNEIDNSILPREPSDIGPMIIGRSLRGPAMRPVTVDSFEEFVNIYGAPVPGGDGDDVWRNGNKLTPTYGAYAAQAWLKNSPTLTFFRLAGQHHINKTATDGVPAAGWRTTELFDQTAVINGNWVDDYVKGDLHTGADPATSSAGIDTHGGAYGMFIFPQNLGGGSYTSGSLAAVWYINTEGSVGLVGKSTFVSKGSTSLANKYGQAEPIASDANGNFTVQINYNGGVDTVTFNMDSSDERFIRKVFNTDPTLLNTSNVSATNRKGYWLGETFENSMLMNSHVETDHSSDISDAGGELGNKYWGVITYLGQSNSAASTNVHAQRNRAFTDPKTGWYISQDLTSATGSYKFGDQQKLFRLCSLGHGEWAQNHLKISIQNIKAPTNNFVKYPTFDVVIRNIADNDKAQQIFEKFERCNLNPKSPNFIGAKIGTQYYEFDTTKRRLVTKGLFPNRSNYVRVELDATVEAGTANEEFVPFGVYGPTKYHDFMVSASISTGYQQIGQLSTPADPTSIRTTSVNPAYLYALGGDISSSINHIERFAAEIVEVGSGNGFYVTSSNISTHYFFNFPTAPLRSHTGQDNLPSDSMANWGVWTGKTTSSVEFNRDIIDLVRAPSSQISEIHAPSDSLASYLSHQYLFTLDDVLYDHTNGRYAYENLSRRGECKSFCGSGKGRSITAQSGSWRKAVDVGINSFTTLMYGGTDGWDVTEKNPIRNSYLSSGGNDEKDNYAFNSIKQAIDSVKDPEFVEYNLITIPGVTNTALTRHLIDIAEDRGDAMAIIDLEGDFQPAAEGENATDVGLVNYGSVSTTVTSLKDRGINSSYAAAYYPFVQVRDTLGGDLIYMPPSVLALGAMSYTDRVKAPWFAPAGFNRGGLSSGIAGLPVVGVTDKLTSEDRDTLYDANINPIASFPSEGIVIFGQKTLQVTRSALDRINVRRLLLFVKKGISRISNELLFEPNVQETWDRFISRANPFLADVKARFGLTEYKLVLDKTTTTPDLIDQNIMYAKVFLKPARAIEFIAVDFVITNTGASFED